MHCAVGDIEIAAILNTVRESTGLESELVIEIPESSLIHPKSRMPIQVDIYI